MKRLLCALLLVAMLLSLCACTSSLAIDHTQGETKSEETEVETQAEETETPLLTQDVVYPQGFSVGYSRLSIAPEEFPIVTYKRVGYTAKSNHDPIQLTCIALCDGENTVLLCAVDLKGVSESFTNYSAKLVEKATGIPKERFFLNATHTHHGPDPTMFGMDENIKKWQKLYYERLIDGVSLALMDLTPARAYAGTAHTEGITFVRRYQLANGSYKCNPSKIDSPVAHESAADTQLRTVRFVREGADDVLMVNYQTHYGGTYPTQVSADFVHPIREQAEEELDCHFVYFNGASGNLNFMSAIPGERKYPNIYAAAPAMVQTVKDAVAKEEEVATGKLQWENHDYQANTKGGSPKSVPLAAVTCGDLGFACAPYEMFDTNGQEIRAASPCKMTFICAYTNGSMGYVPSALAFTHGAYEVESCQFREGCGEEFAQELIRLLNACKSKE